MTPNCAACQWYRKSPIGTSCQHPAAATIDRELGKVFPVLSHILSESPPNREQAFLDCDREGRFEPRHSWWNLWRAA